MEWRIEVESTCSALGTYDGSKYYKEDDCLECIKDLIRFLRRDDDNHVLRRSLGQIGVVKTDLIPILRDYHDDAELFDMCLRLVVNLTSPELLLFREEMPEDKTMRNYYLQLQAHRQMYKKAFIDEKLWAVLSRNLGNLLRKDFDERSEDDRMIIERILILARNILQAPKDASEKRTDGDVSIHDQVLWVLHKSGMEDLLLYIASSDEESQYCLHVLEIISLMFREQDPKHLATANFQRSKDEKVEDELALLKIRNQELEKKKQRFQQFTSSRHSRFGGTFMVQNVKSISERNLIYHKPLGTVNQINFDKEKRPIKIAKNRKMPEDIDPKRRSTLSIRLFLKEFCIEFLHGAYNKLMFIVKDYLNRKKAQQNDETYYLWAIKFFMEFNRIHNYKVELVTETLSKGTFHYVHQQIETYKDNYEHEKKNRPMCLLWARRMHLGIRAYQELLLNLVAMSNSEDAKVKESAVILRTDVFYEPEYRELCLQQLSLYQPEKMSMGFLRDLVETTHVFLKLMETMSKSKHIMVSKKTKKRIKGKSKKSATSGSEILEGGSREANETRWNEISSHLSSILQGQSDQLPTDVMPFDAASDIPIDDQRAAAMYRIQDLLRTGVPGEAIALLRASREVWPENDAFGSSDADAEEEFMALREILFADIPKPRHLMPEETNFEEEEADNEIEDEEEGEGEDRFMTYSVEQEFDFKHFIMKFASKNVCCAYGILFSNYEHNTDFTNMCIIKMFHKIAFDLSLPALLFHVSIFRTFQKIYRDFCITPTNPSLRELTKFAKFLLRKFFEVVPQNKHVFMELCFWKNSREATEIVEGYGTQASSHKEKASYWCEEDEEKLARVFRQLKEMEQNRENNETAGGGDLLDNISAFFIESGKSRRQVARKLKEMALISDIKEVTKKPLKMRAPREWGQEEIVELKSLYEEFKDAVDPVNRILERMTMKRPKKRVVEMIIELGLCDDKKKLMKKRSRRGLKEGDPGYLEQASETDSALEDSSTGSESSGSEQSDESEPEDGGSTEPPIVNALKELTSGDDDFKSAIEWLRVTLSEEADDRDEDEADEEGVAVLPLTEECILAMEREPFLKVMKHLEISPPSNEQEQYWRIPARLTPRALRTKAVLLQRVLAGSFDLEGLDLIHLGGSGERSSKEKKRSKKKKKEKRGPNKWMPMRREVDPETLARIEQLFPARPKPDSAEKSKDKRKDDAGKKSGKKSGNKATKSRKKLKEFEDSDHEDKENRDDNDSSETETKSAKKSNKKKKAKKSNFLDSSSNDSDQENDDQKSEAELESDLSDDGENLASDKKKKSSGGKNKSAFLDSSSDEAEDAKPEKVQTKSKLLESDSSSSQDEKENAASDSKTGANKKSKIIISSDDDSDKEMDAADDGGSKQKSKAKSNSTKKPVKKAPAGKTASKKKSIIIDSSDEDSSKSNAKSKKKLAGSAKKGSKSKTKIAILSSDEEEDVNESDASANSVSKKSSASNSRQPSDSEIIVPKSREFIDDTTSSSDDEKNPTKQDPKVDEAKEKIPDRSRISSRSSVSSRSSSSSSRRSVSPSLNSSRFSNSILDSTRRRSTSRSSSSLSSRSPSPASSRPSSTFPSSVTQTPVSKSTLSSQTPKRTRGGSGSSGSEIESTKKQKGKRAKVINSDSD